MSPVYSPLNAVSAGIFAVLNVAGLTALCPGGIHDDVPQNTSYPFVLFSVQDNENRSLGAKPGSGPGAQSEIRLRVHVFTQDRGMKTAQTAMAKAIELLTAASPAVTGFSSWALFHDDTIPFSDEVVGGVKVKELAANFRLYVAEAA